MNPSVFKVKLEATPRGQSQAFEPAVAFRKLFLEVREVEMSILLWPGELVVEVIMRVWRPITFLVEHHLCGLEQLHTTPPLSISAGEF